MKRLIKSVLVFIIIIGVEVAVGCLIASWFCNINPEKTYSWLGGIWHGLFFIPNLIRSWFTEALFKAEYYTASYNVFWWVFTILSCLGGLFSGNRKK